MSLTASEAALAALSYWVAIVTGSDPPPLSDVVRRAAGLAAGKSEPSESLKLERATPLVSIFSRIQAPGEEAPPKLFVRRAPLALNDALFPVPRQAHSLSDDEALAAGLQQAIDSIDSRLPPEGRVEALLFALQRFAWCLPAPLEGVSLYDFARTHAAIAAALATHDGDLFLLGGDLSGIQAFIYSLSAAGATKSLRGRSFYLQLLTEACARLLLKAADLPPASLLYAGGGRFYALLPGVLAGQPAVNWLANERLRLERFFLSRHQGDLYLALGGGTLGQDDLADLKAFRAVWGSATEAVNAAKRRRFADLGAELLDFFAPQGHGGNEEDACAVCGYQGLPDDLVPIEDDPRGRRRCRLCDSFEDLGRLLHNADHLLLHHLATPAPSSPGRRSRWHDLLAELGMRVQLSGRHARLGQPGNETPRQPVHWTTVLTLEDNPQSHPVVQGPVVYGYRPVANTSPTMTEADLEDWETWRRRREHVEDEDIEQRPREGDVKPFHLMVAQSRGVKRLGVLRMDVDDLGDLFRYRLDGGLASVSALSAALALFFEGWVGHLCDDLNESARYGKKPDERASVYCIYSGGDDLFIVGSWHLLPGLARTISDDLARYTGGNPAVHLSAGISLHGEKFPLYQAARAAEAELKRAKSLRHKAALGWLEQVTPWAHARDLFTIQSQLRDAVGGQLKRALLQTCQQLFAQYVESLKHGRLFYGPWLWRGVYQLARIERSMNTGSAEQALVQDIRTRLIDGVGEPPREGRRYIERLGLAARWAQLELRKDRDNAAGE